jgi:hypothetical protein
MKKFLLRLSFFSLLVISIILFLLYRYGGYVDYFYNKCASPRQSSMIIGDSRSFQGLQPFVFNDNLSKDFDLPMYNFSFTLAQISYGESLLNSIKAKINSKTENGLFVLSVHPYILSQREKDDFEKGIYFEESFPPGNMNYLAMNPNVEYFFKNYDYFHFKAVIRKNSIVHDDGWLEESNLPKDPKILATWKKKQIELYGGFKNKWKKSDYRIKQLIQTIKFLKKHGTVVLVRMPSSDNIVEIENEYWQYFNLDITKLAIENNVQYLDFTKNNSDYKTYDGVHLDKVGGQKFTKSVCDSILKFMKN